MQKRNTGKGDYCLVIELRRYNSIFVFSFRAFIDSLLWCLLVKRFIKTPRRYGQFAWPRKTKINVKNFERL